MTISPAPTAATSAATSTKTLDHRLPTLSWVLLRLMQWLGILALAIAAACLLYGVASKAEMAPPSAPASSAAPHNPG